MEKRRGKYTVFEGLDGIGKGTVISAVEEHLRLNGMNIINNSTSRDFPEHEGGSEFLPHYSNNVFVVCEPTFFGVGEAIRREMIRKKKEGEMDYSTVSRAQAYSLDREVLLKRVVLPVLKSGATVLSSRNLMSSLCYQVLEVVKRDEIDDINSEYGQFAIREVRKDLLELAGNKLAIENAPHLIVISTIRNVEDLRRRLESRLKQDNCVFENLEFQSSLKPIYEDPTLRNLFEKAGSKIAYLDAGISVEASRQQAVEIYSDFYERDGLIKSQYQNP